MSMTVWAIVGTRDYDGIRESFTEQASTIAEEFRLQGFDVDKVIVEFSVYDTKVSHDASWLTASTQ